MPSPRDTAFCPHPYLLGLCGTALIALGSRAIDVMLWNPALIVCLLCHCSSSHGRSICSNYRDLILGVDSLLCTAQ